MNEPGQVVSPMHPGETLGDVMERARIRQEREMEAEWAAYRAQQRRFFWIRAALIAVVVIGVALIDYMRAS